MGPFSEVCAVKYHIRCTREDGVVGTLTLPDNTFEPLVPGQTDLWRYEEDGLVKEAPRHTLYGCHNYGCTNVASYPTPRPCPVCGDEGSVRQLGT